MASQPVTRSKTPPLKAATKALLAKVEKHPDHFDTESERSSAIFGYLTVLCVNLLSCASLALYFGGLLSAGGETECELVFLIMKGVIEYTTGKLTLPLVLHHTIVVIGFFAVQDPWAHCYVWIVVHIQLVHVPFALRALWRLLMPELRLVSPDSNLRYAVDTAMWASWMTIIVYRTAITMLYCVWARFEFQLGWWSIIAFVLVSGLGLIDKGWTEAMWPKPNTVGPSFAVLVRSFAALGLALAVFVWMSDAYPDRLGGLRDALPRNAHAVGTHACLAAQRA